MDALSLQPLVWGGSGRGQKLAGKRSGAHGGSGAQIGDAVSARGMATARLLLSDGTGPLYNRNCPADLSAALREVTARLDPGVSPTG